MSRWARGLTLVFLSGGLCSILAAAGSVAWPYIVCAWLAGAWLTYAALKQIPPGIVDGLIDHALRNTAQVDLLHRQRRERLEILQRERSMRDNEDTPVDRPNRKETKT